MNLRQPPAIASWLLDWLGYTGQNPALAGDLLEEFRSGRSTAWYWRQTLQVIAAGTVRNAFGQRRYVTALLSGFGAQAAVAFGLWRIHTPPSTHGVVAWLVALLALLVVAIFQAEVKSRISGGPATGDLRPLLRSGAIGTRNPRVIMALVAFEAFATYLPAYCICALFFQPFSTSTLALWELTWLVLFALPLALVRVPGARKSKVRKTHDFHQPSLLLTHAGQTILLEPETVVESIFGTGDEQLAAAVFQRSASVELLRRAIWLGCYWGHTPTISLSDLLFLVDKAGHTKPLELFFLNIPDSRWKRLRRRLRRCVAFIRGKA